ncbi:hypothetical protein D3C87_2030210 [compost metagenome]
MQQHAEQMLYGQVMRSVVWVRALEQAHVRHAHLPGQLFSPALLDGGVASPQEIFHS